jgi:dTDP-4-dehydrorhamnose reductase
MKIILTGSTGFVGSRVLFHLQDECHEVTCIPSAMLKGEISDERFHSLLQIISKSEPDAIIHTAAISSTTYSEKYPDESYTANVKLPMIMAKLAVYNKCKLVSCSSDQVYSGCGGDEPHSETEEVVPANVYGRHKLEAEQRILDICPDAVSLRMTWMYDLPVYKTRTNNNFVLDLFKSIITCNASKYSVNEFRGITYVRSVAENITGTLSLPGGVYNYGSENDMNMYDTACCFMESMGMADRIPELIKPTDEQTKSNLMMDCSKIQKYGLNFETTAGSIKKMIADYQGLF